MLKTAVVAQTWGCEMSWEEKREEEKFYWVMLLFWRKEQREIISKRDEKMDMNDKYVKLLKGSTIVILYDQMY